VQQPATDIVCTIREKVIDRIGPSRYQTWFGGATEFEIDGQRLNVTVANTFVGNWITNNFMPHLVDAARDVIGDNPHVEIRVGVGSNGDSHARAAAPPPPRPAPAALHHDNIKRPRPTIVDRPRLRGSLDTLVVGPSNELAHTVAQSVVRVPGAGFKHLVVHGGCGLGKTHLLHGICNGLSDRQPLLSWSYVSGEEFTNEFIYSVKAGRIDTFRARFRNVDVLVIDDIHFLADKKATQEEFLHTFNAIDMTGKAVVMSSDRHPRSIAMLSEPLLNRLLAATIVSIDPPDLAMRREILRQRAQEMPCELPDEILDFVARHVVRNVRELEGALFKLAAYASLTREQLTLEVARRAIEDYITASQPPAAGDIERIAAEFFGVTVDALHSSSRDRTVTHARGFAMYLLRRHTRLSFPEIGRRMGNKQHSTVLMATRRIQNHLDQDGAVTWRTSAGMQETSARDVLETLEQRLVRASDTP
jgi:chromosomal replication initiator protein